GRWIVGALDVGAAERLTLVVRAIAPLPLVNLAVKTGLDQPDPNLANDSAAASAGIPNAADLAVEKIVDLPRAPVGTNVLCTVRVTARGPKQAAAVVIADTLPAGLTLVSATPSQGTFGAGTWLVGTLDVTAQATLTIVATVTAPGPQINNASVSS